MEADDNPSTSARTPADVVNNAAGHDVPCPLCGHTQWEQFDEVPATIAATPERPTDYGGWLAGLYAVRFYCVHCGLVRLHVVRPEAVGPEPTRDDGSLNG